MDPASLIGTASLPWLMATGLVLGALHALEPGHAKTMIASFVVATRGSVKQAVLLGLSAAISHSLLIWILAGAALYFGDRYIGDDAEPWLQVASGVIIVAIGATLLIRLGARGTTRLHSQAGLQGGQTVETGDGLAELCVFDQGRIPELRLFFYDHHRRPVPPPEPETVSVQTIRPDGSSQHLMFAASGASLVSTIPIQGPPEFEAVLSLLHGGHAHQHVLAFGHGYDHYHDHGHAHDHDHSCDHARHNHDEDAHARAHARQIERRLDGRAVTTRQVVLFGLSSGLMPCPAALTMLLVCLRLKRLILGAGLVTAFSLGLAITLVSLGVVAALGVAHASRRLPALDRWVGFLPYCSGALIVGIGIFMGVSGYARLS